MSILITVTVPCQHEISQDEPCEADVSMQVEYTPAERTTWDYPGTWDSYAVVAAPACPRGCQYTFSECVRMDRRAINTAQEVRLS